MHHKLAIKIKVLAICILFLWFMINTFIGISVINGRQELLGLFILIGGAILSLLFYNLISYICDIIVNIYYDVRNIKKFLINNRKETVCPCCKETVREDE